MVLWNGVRIFFCDSLEEFLGDEIKIKSICDNSVSDLITDVSLALTLSGNTNTEIVNLPSVLANELAAAWFI